MALPLGYQVARMAVDARMSNKIQNSYFKNLVASDLSAAIPAASISLVGLFLLSSLRFCMAGYR